jgi:alpha,alpha-trehalase
MTEEMGSSRDLRRNWESLRDRIDASARLCILSDFDGTLVALEAQPDLPRLGGEVRQVLESLSRNPRAIVGVVSGRSLEDLIPRIDLPGIWYVGNHGFEIRDPRGLERRLYEPEDVQYLASVRDEMRKELQRIPGVFLEHKGPVLAVHYRRVEAARVAEVERGFMQVMSRHRLRLMMSTGHAVFEARLRGEANKGRAVSQIRYEQMAGTLVLYFGDDLTDRDAFRELRGVGVSVEVGGGDSSIADYTLPDPEAVLATLLRLRSHLESGGSLRTRRHRSSPESGGGV